MLGADLMVGAVHRSLELRPEAVDGLRVDRALDELPRRVLHALVDVAHGLGLVVEPALVRRQHRAVRGEPGQERQDDCGPRLGQHLGADAPASLHDAEHGRLAVGPETALAVPLAADVGLVGLKNAREEAVVLGHEEPDLTGHAPRALVGHAQLARQLHRGDAVLRRGEQEQRVEPQGQRRRALVEDGPRARREERPTGALVGPPAPDGMEGVGLPALRALGPLRAPQSEDVGEAGRVVGELGLECLDGVFHLDLRLSAKSILSALNTLTNPPPITKPNTSPPPKSEAIKWRSVSMLAPLRLRNRRAGFAVIRLAMKVKHLLNVRASITAFGKNLVVMVILERR